MRSRKNPLDSIDPSVWYGLALVAGLVFLSSKRKHAGLTALRTLATQAFPQSHHPGVLVHIPSGYDASKPLDLVVYFRGFNSCISVLAGREPARCRRDGPIHRHSDLIGQFDRSGANAILIMPELRVEETTGDPGQLGRSGGFHMFLNDVIETIIYPALGVRNGLRRVALCAHSGGYQGTAAAIERGQVHEIDSVCLFDALYGETSVFTRFAARASNEPVHFVSLYTENTTANNSIALASNLQRSLGQRLAFDPSGRPVTQEQWNTPVLIKHVSDEHSWIPLHYFEAFLRSCRFDDR